MTDRTEPQGLVDLGVPTSEAAGVAALAEEGPAPQISDNDVKVEGLAVFSVGFRILNFPCNMDNTARNL